MFKSVNSFLDNLFNSQIEPNENEAEAKTKTIIPDNTFFELYNSLYKIYSENKDESEDTQKENSLVLKTHDLLMKFIDNLEQGKKVDIKIFLSLLKLLEVPIKEDVPNNTYFDSSAEEFITYYERCAKYNTIRNEIIPN